MEARIIKSFPDYNSVKLSTGTVVLFFNRKWKFVVSREKLHGDNYHGALCVALRNVATGRGVDFIVNHTRPKAVATVGEKVEDIHRALDLRGTWPCILMGDWAMNPDSIMENNGLTRMSKNVDTYDPAGVQEIDAIFGDTHCTATGFTLVNPGTISDHKWLRSQIQIGA